MKKLLMITFSILLAGQVFAQENEFTYIKTFNQCKGDATPIPEWFTNPSAYATNKKNKKLFERTLGKELNPMRLHVTMASSQLENNVCHKAKMSAKEDFKPERVTVTELDRLLILEECKKTYICYMLSYVER